MLDFLANISVSDLVGWLVGLIGIIYAWYVNRDARKVRDISRSDAWNLYQLTNVTCGKVQETLKKYKVSCGADADIEVLEQLSKADALSLQSYRAAIRHIQMVEPVFDVDRIKYWVSAKKIPEHQEVDFRQFVVKERVDAANEKLE